MNWIKKLSFYAITLTPFLIVVYLGLIIFFSYVWYADEKYWRAFTPTTTLEHIINQIGKRTLINPYLNTRNIWQAQENCVQLDKSLIYRPSNSQDCLFENIEFKVKINHVDGKRIHSQINRNSDIKHVLVLGDSHAMGWGVKDNETFSALLDAYFDWIGFDNMAVSGYGTPRELMVAQNLLRQGRKYDLILIQYCDNDIGEIQYYYKNKNINKEYIIPIKEGLPISRVKKNFLVQYMNSVISIAKNPLFFTDIPFQGNVNTDYNSYKGMLAAILMQFMSANDFPEIIIFPINGTLKDTAHIASYLNSEVSMLKKQYQTLIHVVDPVSKANDKRRLFFKLDDHLNSEGHAFIAKQLRNTLELELK